MYSVHPRVDIVSMFLGRIFAVVINIQMSFIFLTLTKNDLSLLCVCVLFLSSSFLFLFICVCLLSGIAYENIEPNQKLEEFFKH